MKMTAEVFKIGDEVDYTESREDGAFFVRGTVVEVIADGEMVYDDSTEQIRAGYRFVIRTRTGLMYTTQAMARS